jgi:hypothetical protein
MRVEEGKGWRDIQVFFLLFTVDPLVFCLVRRNRWCTRPARYGGYQLYEE